MATTSVNPSQLNALNDIYRATLQAKQATPEDTQRDRAATLASTVNKTAASETDTDLQRRVTAEEEVQPAPGARSTNLAGQELGRMINATA